MQENRNQKRQVSKTNNWEQRWKRRRYLKEKQADETTKQTE